MKTIGLIVLLFGVVALIGSPLVLPVKIVVGLLGGLFGLFVGLLGGVFGLAVGLAGGIFGVAIGILGGLFGIAVVVATLAVPLLIVAAIVFGVMKLVVLA